MALYYDLPVYKDVHDLALLLMQYTSKFPREYKYSLGQDMKRDSIQLVRSIYKANSNKDKTEHLDRFLEDFEVLRLEVRLSVDLHILSVKEQSQIAELMDRIGKQITGWRNSSARRMPEFHGSRSMGESKA